MINIVYHECIDILRSTSALPQVASVCFKHMLL
uniref:Uncharacterized protein n=1 Tax=Arundo donax TaxID=35708 RepID=A0A0A8Y635_ARUDO